MNNKYYISTAIPYINASAHIGHVQEFLLADTLKKVLKAEGHEVFLQSGTDDNSLKNIQAAEKLDLDPKEYLKLQGDKFKSLLSTLGIDLDGFIQTSHPEHHRAVTTFIEALNPLDLYSSEYKGLYCVGCEDYLKESDLEKGLCVDHKLPPTEIKEENVFFRLSKYQDQIYELINSNKVKIYPLSKKKEILSFISRGLLDISISRPTSDSISIPFPGVPNQSVYVWIDALVNYLTGTGYGSSDQWKDIWNESYKIHVIGKNVWKFHAIYWIGLLLSAKIEIPNEIIIHGFLTNEGQKISKSLGNSVDPLELLKEIDRDTVRAFLLGKLNYESDADFKKESIDQFYLDVLNQVGNLYPRVLKLAVKSGILTIRERQRINGENFRDLNGLFTKLITLSQSLNKEINDSLIWKKPSSPEKTTLIESWISQLNIISDHLEIFFPDRSSLINNSFKGEEVVLFNKKL